MWFRTPIVIRRPRGSSKPHPLFDSYPEYTQLSLLTLTVRRVEECGEGALPREDSLLGATARTFLALEGGSQFLKDLQLRRPHPRASRGPTPAPSPSTNISTSFLSGASELPSVTGFQAVTAAPCQTPGGVPVCSCPPGTD